jgi:DNA-binding MarR family transcriptional regulator
MDEQVSLPESEARTAADPRWLDPDQQDAWLGLAGLLIKVPAVLDAQLQRDAGLSLFEYFVLSSLSMSEDRTSRMSDLAELTNGSLSRLSNVVKRLEQRGWVRREPDPVDGRFTNAILTDEGWDLVVVAAPGHVGAVQDFILDPLTPSQVHALRDIGRSVLNRIDPGVPFPNRPDRRPEC